MMLQAISMIVFGILVITVSFALPSISDSWYGLQLKEPQNNHNIKIVGYIMGSIGIIMGGLGVIVNYKQ